MKMGLMAAASAAVALLGGSASALTFADYVNVLVPGQVAVTFQSFNDTTAPETFVGTSTVPVGFTPGTVILTEPGSNTVSDILTLLVGQNGGLTILFYSDPGLGGATILANPLTIPETGGVQDVSSQFGPPGTISVQIGSDIDAIVPEPATWGLMLVGMGLAGSALRTRRRTATA